MGISTGGLSDGRKKNCGTCFRSQLGSFSKGQGKESELGTHREKMQGEGAQRRLVALGSPRLSPGSSGACSAAAKLQDPDARVISKSPLRTSVRAEQMVSTSRSGIRRRSIKLPEQWVKESPTCTLGPDNSSLKPAHSLME